MTRSWKVAKRLARYPSAVLQSRVVPDVVHFTYYDPRQLTAFPGVPKVVTVHDMVPEKLPPELVDGEPHMAKRAFVDAADAIICVSEATRDDLFEVWGPITDRPVIITGHATSDRFHPQVAPADLGYRYVLYVGSRDHYKNFPLLMTAYAGSAAQAAGVRLLAVGGGRLTEDEVALAATLGIGDDLVQLTAAEADLPGLYRGAELFVFPSLFEGFGMPVLEAMATGTPAVLADIPVFHEVAGPAAVYYSPEDPWALRTELDRLLADPTERARLATAGVQRAGEYSWRRTALTTAELYRQLVAGRP
jgi:glycosyltransferase involved in cell wall biosynthesis